MDAMNWYGCVDSTRVEAYTLEDEAELQRLTMIPVRMCYTLRLVYPGSSGILWG